MNAVNEDTDHSEPAQPPEINQLERAFSAVGDLVLAVRPEQWSAPTPCSEWSVRELVGHLIGMNRVFVALLNGQPPPPRRGTPEPDSDLSDAFRDSSAILLSAFAQPDVLTRVYQGPLGTTTGAERAQIRLYDLLAHAWDLARATGQPVMIPEDLSAGSLTFARRQVLDTSRPGRFAPAQAIPATAPALDQLAAFLGRSPQVGPAPAEG